MLTQTVRSRPGMHSQVLRNHLRPRVWTRHSTTYRKATTSNPPPIRGLFILRLIRVRPPARRQKPCRSYMWTSIRIISLILASTIHSHRHHPLKVIVRLRRQDLTLHSTARTSSNFTMRWSSTSLDMLIELLTRLTSHLLLGIVCGHRSYISSIRETPCYLCLGSSTISAFNSSL